ncbi:Cysteine-rich PDZ-binding protein [Strongyloides ratti]|uniref:Cysteine-rich PDZ-binding protein n=1 Tax=Strongyloides ratti TaxID=34506 RepID=A0A090L4T9_STRRB|nr:Cysteine-rich PDZ-binding protein [Strongyloides ratti]CEF64811.1 Cysteine-rich PDZ-binding protein [Strongyloides ratti]
MVCEKCTSKLRQLPSAKKLPNSRKPSSLTTIGSRPLLPKDKFKPNNKESFKKCKICKKPTHREGAYYCQDCSYQKGICALCGMKIANTSSYKQSNT